MTQVRQPAVAGLFYPQDPAALKTSIDSLLETVTSSGPAPKAIIAPHAGYVYSGPVAATVYARLTPVKKVLLIGPAHRVYCRGIALSSAETFRTPLGDVPIDQAAFRSISTLSQVQLMDAAHAQEHSLEVHLPFLQHCIGEFQLLPMVIGDASAEEVAQVIRQLWVDEETLVVVSTDLSHFLNYESALSLDTRTTGLIENHHQQLESQQACGCRALNGFLRVAKERELKVTALDVRNSGDTAGPRDRVVGYGAFSIE